MSKNELIAKVYMYWLVQNCGEEPSELYRKIKSNFDNGKIDEEIELLESQLRQQEDFSDKWFKTSVILDIVKNYGLYLAEQETDALRTREVERCSN